MDYRQQLAENLLSETSAYGYTLSIWGGGALLLSRFGTPTPPEVFYYVAGAVAAFGVLAAVAFGQLTVRPDDDRSTTVNSFVHIAATLGNLAVSYLLTVAPVVVEDATFALVGFQATLVYNLLLLPEAWLAKRSASQ
ncbi:hypothetical protein DMJ13_08720 [halophilic archaeon]|nr:hypothetical protein DMJ13_08720 [halophilic archaeon]